MRLKNEYWFTDGGKLVTITPRNSHEGYVRKVACKAIMDAIGLRKDYGDDCVSLRVEVFDYELDHLVQIGNIPEEQRWDFDPWDVVRQQLMKTMPEQRADQVIHIVGSSGGGQADDDARRVACRDWGWVRISGGGSFHTINVPRMTPDFLKRAARAASLALKKEGGSLNEIDSQEFEVSTYDGKAYGMTVEEMRGGSAPSAAVDLDKMGDGLAAQGRKAARQADADLERPFYRGKLGDSIEFQIRSLLREGQFDGDLPMSYFLQSLVGLKPMCRADDHEEEEDEVSKPVPGSAPHKREAPVPGSLGIGRTFASGQTT